jgi:hypothetical protein
MTLLCIKFQKQEIFKNLFDFINLSDIFVHRTAFRRKAEADVYSGSSRSNHRFTAEFLLGAESANHDFCRETDSRCDKSLETGSALLVQACL